jgi:hypothetical protein
MRNRSDAASRVLMFQHVPYLVPAHDQANKLICGGIIQTFQMFQTLSLSTHMRTQTQARPLARAPLNSYTPVTYGTYGLSKAGTVTCNVPGTGTARNSLEHRSIDSRSEQEGHPPSWVLPRSALSGYEEPRIFRRHEGLDMASRVGRELAIGPRESCREAERGCP